MAGPIPSHARVVIIGGGIVGCSVAYHLTKLGWRDVLVLGRRQLSCGTAWLVAGLVGQLRSSHNLTRLASYGAVLYEQLEAETGQATGFRRSGSVSVARTAERMIELKRGASMAKCFGVDVELISPREAGRLWPLMRTDDLAGAVWIPRDGRTNPIDTTLALAKGARQGGATIVENVTVTAIHRERGAATGVSTDSGDVACEVVVNCAGLWGRDVGRMAGVNSVGIASAAGAGKALAEWIVGGEPSMDLWDVDIRRFMPFQGNARYLRERITEVVGLLYAMHWPFRQPVSARGMRRSMLHERLAAHGAVFGVVAGWERANWFATAGVEPRYVYTYGRQNWVPCAAAEHRAVREAVGLFDQSSLAKFLVQGPAAAAVLQRLCANDVDVAPGRIVYTQMLNARGGIECDLTVTRLADDAYLVVTIAAAATHDADWIRRGIGAARVTLTDVTSAFTVLGVMGPRSRELLSRLTDADLSNAAFPFGTSREIELGHASVRATRITYVGELGWELYVPTEFATRVYDDVIAAGADLGLRHAGYHAMDSLRMEKGYRSWGHDIGSEDTPLMAGLDFAVAFKKDAFAGRDALLRQRGKPLSRWLVMFTLDDPAPLLLGDEPIYRDGALIGRITSGAYGHTLGRSVGMGYVAHADGVDAAFVRAGRWELEIALERFAATAHLEPPYDPASTRVRG